MRAFSIYQLIYVAVLAVVAPLLAALGVALFNMQDLAALSRQDVFAAQQSTQHVRDLADRLAELERSALQFEHTHTAANGTEYEAMRASFIESLDDIDASTRGAHAVTARLHAEESEIHRRIEAAPVDTDATLSLFGALYSGVQALLDDSAHAVSRYANQPSQAAVHFERTLLWWVVPIASAAVLIGVALLLTIIGPLKSLEAAIRKLGNGHLDTPVRIAGPRDVVELGRSLDWMRQRLLALEEQKVSFLRNISHALKTPLTSIREGAHLLRYERAPADDAERRQIAQILFDSSTRLNGLIEQLIQLSRLSDTPETPTVRAVALDDVVRTVLHEHRLAIVSRAIVLTADLERCTVSGNEGQIATLIDNLVSNAVKFCDHAGRVSVTLGADGNWARLDVEDSGPGIAPHERARVFELFYRGTAATNGRASGTGLGLTIAMEYAQQNGGRIEVLEPPTGAHLRVWLPQQGTERNT